MLRSSSPMVAVGFLIFLSCDYIKKGHEVIFSRYRISTPSMSPTLNIGDVHHVFSSETFSVNDLVTYRPPAAARGKKENVVWLHRLVAIPGDILEMKKGVLFRNGILYKPEINLKHSYIVRTSMPLNKKRTNEFEYDMIGDDTYMFHATREEIVRLKENRAVTEVTPKILNSKEESSDSEHMIVAGNPDNWGPVRIPKKGDEIIITAENQKQYYLILREYEPTGKEININDKFIVKKDYYFVLGDNRHNALDSRYLGFIPYDQMQGIMSLD